MSAISTLLTRLQNTLSTLRAAIWAIDVRDDIADAIEECGQMVEQCYSDVSNPTLQTEALEAALQNKIDEGEMAALTIGDHTITAKKLAQGVIDNTLATSGAAADAAETGRQFGLIKADLDALIAPPRLDDNTDLNSVIESGVYTLYATSSYLNKPTQDGEHGILEVWKEKYGNTGRIFQKLTYTYKAGRTNSEIWVRSKSGLAGGGWTPWVIAGGSGLTESLLTLRYIKDYPNGCILDKEGNVILSSGVNVKQTDRYAPQYPGGAVFDSEGRLMLVGESQYNPLKGLKVSIIGDSISAYEGWIPTGYVKQYPDNDTIDNVNKMWWKRLIDMSGMELCVNAAWSGSKVSGNLLTDQTARPACSNQRIADLKNPTTEEEPNIVICFIGTNDWSSGIAIGNFDSTSEIPEDGNITDISTAYALMLYKIRTSYQNAHIFCIPPLSRNLLNSSLITDDSYPILNSRGESIHQISKKIEELALLFGATVINMERMGMSYWNISRYLRADTLHPNAAGMEMIAVRCYKVIKDYFRGLEF